MPLLRQVCLPLAVPETITWLRGRYENLVDCENRSNGVALIGVFAECGPAQNLTIPGTSRTFSCDHDFC